MNIGGPRDYFEGLQARIVGELEALDGKPFRRDEWARPEGGGGIARVIEDGNVFAELMNTVRVCSLGQITNTLFEVGGQYRRSM